MKVDTLRFGVFLAIAMGPAPTSVAAEAPASLPPQLRQPTAARKLAARRRGRGAYAPMYGMYGAAPNGFYGGYNNPYGMNAYANPYSNPYANPYNNAYGMAGNGGMGMMGMMGMMGGQQATYQKNETTKEIVKAGEKAMEKLQSAETAFREATRQQTSQFLKTLDSLRIPDVQPMKEIAEAVKLHEPDEKQKSATAAAVEGLLGDMKRNSETQIAVVKAFGAAVAPNGVTPEPKATPKSVREQLEEFESARQAGAARAPLDSAMGGDL